MNVLVSIGVWCLVQWHDRAAADQVCVDGAVLSHQLFLRGYRSVYIVWQFPEQYYKYLSRWLFSSANIFPDLAKTYQTETLATYTEKYGWIGWHDSSETWEKTRLTNWTETPFDTVSVTDWLYMVLLELFKPHSRHNRAVFCLIENEHIYGSKTWESTSTNVSVGI
jgi:hypothetical protein